MSGVAVGDLAEQAVKPYFKEELAFGRVGFVHVNNHPKNTILAAK
jgi:hypothetical protein